jgi:hypothetical protein
MKDSIIDLSEDDFRRGYVGDRPPSILSPRPKRHREVGRVVGIALLYGLVGVLAVIAWRGREPAQQTLTVATP